jgi:hypothetical protein
MRKTYFALAAAKADDAENTKRTKTVRRKTLRRRCAGTRYDHTNMNITSSICPGFPERRVPARFPEL